MRWLICAILPGLMSFTGDGCLGDRKIAGTVSGAVAAGVVVELSGTRTARATTDSAGRYTFHGVANGLYRVTPSHVGYVFSPPDRAVEVKGAGVEGVDFTAATTGCAISGRVAGAVRSNAVVKLRNEGGIVREARTNQAGGFVFEGVACDQYTVTPFLPGYVFTPISQEATNRDGAVVLSQPFVSEPDCRGRWCSVSPKPGTAIRAVWGNDRNDVWALGGKEGRGAIYHWNGEEWASVRTATMPLLKGIWGSGPNDIWAVGQTGAIVHWNGKSWRTVSSGTQAGLNDVWGSGPRDVWAVGAEGTVLHWNGDRWAPISDVLYSTLSGIWGSGPNDVWVVGEDGSIVRWNGKTWEIVSGSVGFRLNKIWGSGPNDVWAVGSAIFHWDGTSWTNVKGDVKVLTGIWGVSVNEAWSVGEWGTVLRWDGTNWTAVDSGTAASFLAIWGADSDAVWIFGNDGSALRWIDGKWTQSEKSPISEYRNIWGSGPDDIWMIKMIRRVDGVISTLIHWDGEKWSSVDAGAPEGEWFQSVWGNGPDDIWVLSFEAATGAGRFRHWDGQSWQVKFGMNVDNMSVHIWTSGDNVWVMGDYSGYIHRWNGTTLTQEGTWNCFFHDIWGSGPNDVWVVGYCNGTSSHITLHWDGRGWLENRSPYGVESGWSGGPNDVWAVSECVSRWDRRKGWVPTTCWEGKSLTGMWGSGPNDIWVSGRDGAVIHWDGSSWTSLDSEVSVYLLEGWSGGSGEAWVVGQNGTILHYQP